MQAAIMKAIVLWLLKNSKYIGLAVLLAGIAFKANSFIKEKAEEKAALLHQVDVLKKDRDTALQNFEVAKATAEANRLALETIQKDRQKQEQVTAELNKKLEESKQFSKKLYEGVANSKPQDDGAVAPVLLNTIEAIQKKNAEKK